MNKLFCRKEFSRFVLLIVFIFSSILTTNAAFRAGTVQNRDSVDPSFNAQIQTTTFLFKGVSQLIELPDGKILASGNFNRYNGSPVGGLIRLNADATLDTSFNNDLLTSDSPALSITLQPDGKILLQGSFKLTNGTDYTNTIVRLNPDGAIDTSFNYTFTGYPFEIRIDLNGRILVSGNLRVNINNQIVDKAVIRLNATGSIDPLFDAQFQNGFSRFTTQNNKIVYSGYDRNTEQIKLYRLNEDGSFDNSFVPTIIATPQILEIKARPNNKILVLGDYKVFQINENGGIDPDFQFTTNPLAYQARNIRLYSDGKITVRYGVSNGDAINRLLPNGVSDPSFTPYTSANIGDYAVQSDGGLLIGDRSSDSLNRFVRLLPSGMVDASFNPGGSGFLNIKPGKIGAISVLASEKILIGGDFDKVNNIDRKKIAQINPDGSLDTAFQIQTSGTGNYFSTINDIYYFAVQTDGKIIVSGNFEYFVNGAQKSNLVKLNANGSIDSTFNLSVYLADWFITSTLGKNKPVQKPDGKILIATTRPGITNTTTIPLVLTSTGAKDTSFDPIIFNTKDLVTIYDAAVIPDGKILIAGMHSAGNINGNVLKGFIARLNVDGTIDQNFQITELVDKQIFAFTVLENGQILIVAGDNLQRKVFRLNTDGSNDNSFNSGIGANGKINAIAVLPDNKILVGGAFSLYDNEVRKNLAMLNADGTLYSSPGNINDEVLCITVDNQGRVLVGGRFTSISFNEQTLSSFSNMEEQVSRSYLVRLNVSSVETVRQTNFDFDGDGKADPTVYRSESGVWHLQQTQSGYAARGFGISTDKLVPADYDGDGKTDLAVFRENPTDPGKAKFYIQQSSDNKLREEQFGATGDIPVSGDWDGDGKSDIGVYRSGTQANPQGYFYYRPSSKPSVDFVPYPWGSPGDKPVIADFDGDGKTDAAVFRPSTGEWFIQRSRDGFYAIQFGATEDKPVVGDYDGDGKADQAVFRSSNGVWYIWNSTIGFSAAQFGVSTDKPAPADYDGDGKTDIAVYRDGNWFLLNSYNGFAALRFGNATDKPIPNAFVP